MYERLRLPLFIDGGDEEHVACLDEGTVAVVDAVMNDALLDPIRETARIKTILELPTAVVVQAHAPIFSGNPHLRQTFREDNSGSRTTEGAAPGGRGPFLF